MRRIAMMDYDVSGARMSRGRHYRACPDGCQEIAEIFLPILLTPVDSEGSSAWREECRRASGAIAFWEGTVTELVWDGKLMMANQFIPRVCGSPCLRGRRRCYCPCAWRCAD